MKVYISADMEGASGISGFHQVKPGSAEFDVYREIWTQDLNRLVEGALSGGAQSVLINEGHAGMNYLYPHRLHPKAQVIEGRMKARGQMEGIESGMDLAFILCHTRAGSPGVLSHTFVPTHIWDMRLNGSPIGEIGMNMAMAGEFGVPVGLIVGDQYTYEEAKAYCPNILPVVTKEAITQFTACCRSREEIQEQLYSQAAKAVQMAREFSIYQVQAPYTLEVTFSVPVMAELISYIPGMRVLDRRTVSYTCEDYQELMKIRILITNLTRVASEQLW